ncbi:hypothetical protein BC833DRAFT_244202 [Globomyces pollinis-pini]|nr:hypothetical protein BC833DRAFT_244202 [Globomyces pollinis-pini]
MKNTLEIQKKIKNSMDSSQNPTLNIQDVSIESTTESNSMPNYQDGNNLSAKPSLTESIDAITVLNSASSETITQRTTTVTTIHTDFDLTNNDKISSDSPILTSFQLLPDFTHFNDDEFLGFPYNTEPNVFKTKSLKVEYPQHENNLVTDNLKSDSDVLNRNLQNDSENNANNGMDEETKLNQTKNTNEIVHYRALDVQPSPNPNVELIDDSPTQSPKNHLYNTNPNQLINTNSTQKIDLFDSQKSSKFYGLETYSSDEDGEFDKRYSMKSDASSNLDSYGPHSRSSELENSAIPEVFNIRFLKFKGCCYYPRL